MERNESPGELARRFGAAEEAESATLLHTLLVEVAAPVVRRTVKRRFGSARGTTAEDLEDVCGDALAAVITRLRRYREGAPEVADFAAYAATVASNLADRFFAARAPQRTRLRNRIRYVLTTDAHFSMSESEVGACVCRLNKSSARSRSFPASALGFFRNKLSTKPPGGKLAELLKELLSGAPEGVELSELSTLAAYALGVTDRTESVDDYAEFLVHPAIAIAHSAELKDGLKWLWTEVGQLPMPQRVALLLNLGTEGGAQSGTTLCGIAELGVATFSSMAETLGMTEGELAKIWNRVPLDDKEIGMRLFLNRQQVSNLRASARQRLIRRRTAAEKAGPRTNTAALPDTLGIGE